MTTKRIAVFFQNPWLETLPFIREPIVELARLGFEIHIFAPASGDFPPISIQNNRIKVIEFYFGSNKKTFIPILFRILWHSYKNRYSLFIANPNDSLILGAIAAALMRKPLIAFSDEIYTTQGIRKHSLSWSYQSSKFIVITDLTRVSALEDSLGNPGCLRYHELPNCPAQGILSSHNFTPHPILKIISLGWFHDSLGASIILEALKHFKGLDVVFVVHDRSTRQDISSIYRELIDLIEFAYPINFQTTPLPYGEVDSLVLDADIGLAFYPGNDLNITLCGKGSGKIARYLKNAKPVIVFGENLRWLVDYGAGEYASSGTELVFAIKKIRGMYEVYSRRALECYNKHFQFERHFDPIKLEILRSLTDS